MSQSESQASNPTHADNPEERSERSYKAAAHNPRNAPETRLHAAEKFAEMYEKRTGEHIDPEKEAQVTGSQRSRSRSKERQG